MQSANLYFAQRRGAGLCTSLSTFRSSSLRRFSSSALSPWLLYVLAAGSSSTSACTCRRPPVLSPCHVTGQIRHIGSLVALSIGQQNLPPHPQLPPLLWQHLELLSRAYN